MHQTDSYDSVHSRGTHQSIKHLRSLWQLDAKVRFDLFAFLGNELENIQQHLI